MVGVTTMHLSITRCYVVAYRLLGDTWVRQRRAWCASATGGPALRIDLCMPRTLGHPLRSSSRSLTACALPGITAWHQGYREAGAIRCI